MKCHNDPKRYYKGTEPSPKGRGYCAHCEPLDKEMEGLDGRVWKVVKNKNGIKRWGSPRGEFGEIMEKNISAPFLMAPNVVSTLASSFRTGLFYVMSPTLLSSSIYKYNRNGIELDILVEKKNGVPVAKITNGHGLKPSKITPDEIGYINEQIDKTDNPWKRAAAYAISKYYHDHNPSIQ